MHQKSIKMHQISIKRRAKRVRQSALGEQNGRKVLLSKKGRNAAYFTGTLFKMVERGTEDVTSQEE